MSKLRVYQKPTCATCRKVVRQLHDEGIEFDSINYYEVSFTVLALKKLCKKMKISPRELMRTKESIYKELELAKTMLTDDELLALMVKHPELIQRPIIVKGKKAVLARPVEKLQEIL